MWLFGGGSEELGFFMSSMQEEFSERQSDR